MDSALLAETRISIHSHEVMKLSYQAAQWTTKYMNDLPDSAFALVVKGDKDGEGKTVPRTNRNLPHHDATGKVDLPHLRNAMARVTHTSLSKEQQKQAHDHLLGHYRKLGMPHPPCSVPGCKGYESSGNKSMLGDVDTFRSYQQAWHSRCNGPIA
jgi:hypothetical protein